MRPTFLLLISLFASVIMGYAQQKPAKIQETTAPGKISGRLVDSATRKEIAFGTVALFRASDNKAVNGAAADEDGKFLIQNVPFGTYYAVFDFLGYKKTTKKDVVISEKNKKIVLGDVFLAPTEKLLNEVTVTGNKAIIENQADKIVYNAERDVTSQGGVATDVLKKVPQVSVDVDGNVEVQGNSSIKFLIDGKPSTVFGNNITEVLQSIPASQIQSIEVITAPGAKYDAEGTGGIINIILKKSDVRGYNGSVNGAVTSRNINGSFNFNARMGKFGAHAWAGGNRTIRGLVDPDALSTMTRNSQDTANKTSNTLIQNGHSNFFRGGYWTGASFDWDITPKDNISASVSYNSFTHSDAGLTNQQSASYNSSGLSLSDIYSVLDNSSSFGSNTLDYSLTYRKQFDNENQSLSFLATASDSKNPRTYEQTQNSADNDTVYSGTRGINNGQEKEYNISLDYSQPIGKDLQVETGLKTIITQINSTNSIYTRNYLSDYVYDNEQSNWLAYNRNVYAAYLSASYTILKDLHLKAGIRYEYTTTQAAFSQADHVNIAPYGTWSPSAVASKEIGNGQSIKLAYNRRLERPDYRRLNPSINAADPRNMTTGDPNLQPELSDKIEAGYNKSFEKGGNLYTSVFYAISYNDVKPYVVYYPTLLVGDSTYSNVALTNYGNIGREYKTGISISGSIPITSKWNARGNISVFDRRIINTLYPGQNSDGIDYRINVNMSYMIDSSLIAEGFCNYNSPVSSFQGKTPSWSSYSLAIRKEFLHKKASIGFTTTNPFTEYVVMNTDISGPNFHVTSTRKVPIQSFGINFSYKFGKLEFRERRPENEGGEGGGME